MRQEGVGPGERRRGGQTGGASKGSLLSDEVLAAERALDRAKRNRDAAVAAALRTAREKYEEARRARDETIVQAMRSRMLPYAEIAKMVGLSVSRIKQLPAELSEAGEASSTAGEVLAHPSVEQE